MTFLFPQLCLKEELLKMMRDSVNESDLVQWIKVGFVAGPLYRFLLLLQSLKLRTSF